MVTLTIGNRIVSVVRRQGETPECVLTFDDSRHFTVPIGIFSILERAAKYPLDSQLQTSAASIVQTIEERIQNTRRRGADPGFGFWLKIPVLSAPIANRIAERLRYAFAPRIWPVLALAIVSGVVIALLNHGSLRSLGPGWDLGIAYLIAFATYGLHELGHATALRYAGARPGRIGFTMYLIFPAFYSDVTDAWRLARKQRIIVDIAGSFFECFLFLPIAIALVLTHLACFWYALLLTGASLVSNFNPVFRFDGYWVIRDYFGTGNVFRISKLAGAADGKRNRFIARALAYALCIVWLAYALTMLVDLKGSLLFASHWIDQHIVPMFN